MKNLLIVSPHFPPVNAPDMHRVRMSIPEYENNSWKPHVLAVEHANIEVVKDDLLAKGFQNNININFVNAIPLSITKKLGITNIGIRSILHLYFKGREVIKKNKIDLVFFSTTQFVTLILGRLWKKEFGTPYVIDMQDPWVGDYYEKNIEKPKPPKYKLARFMHRQLEPFAMKNVDGIISVTSDYIKALSERYINITDNNSIVIPFGFSYNDLINIDDKTYGNRYLKNSKDKIVGCYVGVLGSVMASTCRAICEAIRHGLEKNPNLFEKVKLCFIGTDYAVGSKSKKTIEPIAKDMEIDHIFLEETERVPYYEMLNILESSDFLLIVGSDDPSYTASKVYPYISLKKPILAILHEDSSATEVLRSTNSAILVTFNSADNISKISNLFFEKISFLLDKLPYEPEINFDELNKYSSKELTKEQCIFFDKVLQQN